MKNLLSIIAASLLSFPVLALPAISGSGNMKNDEESLKPKMVKIPGKNYEMMTTEVTQGLYKSIMGKNPSQFKNTDSYPVEGVTWCDAIYFCNKLSEKFGLEPVYSVNGSTDVRKWNYTPNGVNSEIGCNTIQDRSANGYRLPTKEEWEYAAWGGRGYKYAGSDNLDEVGWYYDNSGGVTHPVAQKKPNGYGLYDMSGNVWEWCWDTSESNICFRYKFGGNWRCNSSICEVDNLSTDRYDLGRRDGYGFRLVRTVYKSENKAEPKAEIIMVKIPGENYEMMNTEVTQGMYKEVMGENPSMFRKDNYELSEITKLKLPENTDSCPVEQVSWYDAIYFCNKLSQKCGLEPVYSVNGSTDVTKWNYMPHKKESISGEITQNTSASGYRLPTEDEWEDAARGGQNYHYAGSDDNLDKVGWYDDNSGDVTHPVAQKKPNGYGLYDMSGNVAEWCWDIWDIWSSSAEKRSLRGGSWYFNSDDCRVGIQDRDTAGDRRGFNGFRLARTLK